MSDAVDSPINISTAEEVDTASLLKENVSNNNRMTDKRNSFNSTTTEELDAGKEMKAFSKDSKKRRKAKSLQAQKNESMAKSLEEHNMDVTEDQEVQNDLSTADDTEESTNLSQSNLTVPRKKKRSRRNTSYLKPRKRKVKMQPTDEYEVEMIIDYKVEEDVPYYLVKWKGWSEEYDSWVPKGDLFCPALVKEFESKKQRSMASEEHKEATSESSSEPIVSEPLPEESLPEESLPEEPLSESKSEYQSSELQTYIEGLFKPSHDDIELAIKIVCNSAEKPKVNGIKPNMTSENLNKFAQLVYSKKQKLLLLEKTLMMQVLTRDFLTRRIEQQLRLKEWEEEINLIAQGNPPIKVENNCDLEEPPVGFTYVTQCIAGEGVTIPDDPMIGCECSDCIDCRKTCCGPMSGSQSAYTKLGRLKVPVGTPIYECNDRCLCGSECPNRVVQRGTKVRLCIFRTHNGRGWGIKTLETIRKNSFVIEYIGEIITNEEAESRGVKYDSEGRTYLFDLDFNDIDCMYSIDAARMGNASHFINHSCDPNLAVFAVWSNCLDPNMPRLALFTQRDIHAGEELTFDYASSKTEQLRSTEATASEEGETKVKNECRCGAKSCRKIMFSLPESQVSFHTAD